MGICALLDGFFTLGCRLTAVSDPWYNDHRMEENDMGREIVDVAVAVHRGLGPGLLESVYEVVLSRELEMRGLEIDRQVPVAITYQGMRFEEGFRADLVVEGRVIVELKSVSEVTRAHKKQLLTYMRLGGFRLGFLLNFGTALMREGIFRVVDGLDEVEEP
jgi:GxxExxY protein